jgi:hypothetical protein
MKPEKYPKKVWIIRGFKKRQRTMQKTRKKTRRYHRHQEKRILE